MSTKIFMLGELSLKTDIDSFCWSTSDINIAERNDFSNMTLGDEFKLVVGPYIWELMIVRKSLNRQNVSRPGQIIAAASPTFKLGFEKITKTYPSIFAKDAVEDILGYQVASWTIANWKIPKNVLVFENTKKIDAIRTITNAVKATIQTGMDGNITISKKYPIPPAYWEKAQNINILETDSNEFSYSETFERLETYNFITVGNGDDDLQCEIETDINNSSGRGHVRLYPIPWRMMGLVTTAEGVFIGYPSIIESKFNAKQ